MSKKEIEEEYERQKSADKVLEVHKSAAGPRRARI